jgi:hypothetical protein
MDPEKLIYWDVVRDQLWDPLGNRRFKKAEPPTPPITAEIPVIKPPKTIEEPE